MEFKIGDKVKFESYNDILTGTVVDIRHNNIIKVDAVSMGEWFIKSHALTKINVPTETYNDVLKQCTVNRDSTGKVCTCDSRALFNHGCRCGAIERYDVNKHWR